MSREFVFLSLTDHNNIFSHQLAEVCHQFRRQLTGCKLMVDASSGVLNIAAPISMVDSVGSIKDKLLRESYLKLGCGQITLYCMGEWLWDYNWHESTFSHAENDMSSTTLERSIEAANAAVADKYISLERAAVAMKMSPDELIDLLEQQSIPVIFRQRQPWGMDAQAARNLAEWNYHQQLISMGLEYDNDNPPLPMPVVEEPAAALAISTPVEEPVMEAELEPSQFASAIKNGSSESAVNNVVVMPSKGDASPEMNQLEYWTLPDGYTIKPTPKTTFKVALRNALMQLEMGDRFLAERLKCLKSPRKFPEAKAFLELITAQYKSKPDVTKAISELQEEVKVNPLPPSAS